MEYYKWILIINKTRELIWFPVCGGGIYRVPLAAMWPSHEPPGGHQGPRSPPRHHRRGPRCPSRIFHFPPQASGFPARRIAGLEPARNFPPLAYGHQWICVGLMSGRGQGQGEGGRQPSAADWSRDGPQEKPWVRQSLLAQVACDGRFLRDNGLAGAVFFGWCQDRLVLASIPHVAENNLLSLFLLCRSHFPKSPINFLFGSKRWSKVRELLYKFEFSC